MSSYLRRKSKKKGSKLVETYRELEEEILVKMNKNWDNVEEFHESIWPAVMKCETFFQKSKDVQALELQVELLFAMDDNIYLCTYLFYAYITCKRILELDPTKEKAKNTIENHIIPYFVRDFSDPKLKGLNISNENVEKNLEKEFKKAKEDNFGVFLDDFEGRHTLVDENDDKLTKDGFRFTKP